MRRLLLLLVLCFTVLFSVQGFSILLSQLQHHPTKSTRSLVRLFAKKESSSKENLANDNNDDDDNDLSLEAFAQVKQKFSRDAQAGLKEEKQEEFDGYALRDVIFAKWGEAYDVDFNRVDSFGFRKLYLNILPFRLGKRPFRHATEYDYLCHLQAVVEILRQYNQLDYVLYQIQETKKKPIAGRVPIVAVPIRLDLTNEQIDSILGY